MKTNHTKDEHSDVEGIVQEFKEKYPNKMGESVFLRTTLTKAITEAEERGRKEERKRFSPLVAIVQQFYQDADSYSGILQYEVDSMAFYRDTGMWPPGKSNPAEMYVEPHEERHEVFKKWIHNVDELIGNIPTSNPTKT